MRIETMTIDRRSVLKYGGVIPLLSAAPPLFWATADQADEKADYCAADSRG
jgi:uncharacterized protein (DUF1501 family)